MSLFGADCRGGGGDDLTYAETIWEGAWGATSLAGWLLPQSPVRGLTVSFDLLLDWVGPASGEPHPMLVESRPSVHGHVYLAPHPAIEVAQVAGATVTLRHGALSPHFSNTKLFLEAGAEISAVEPLTLADVETRWVRPLYHLLAFFAMGDPGLRAVKAWSQSGGEHALWYPAPFNISLRDRFADNWGWDGFATLGDLRRVGCSLEDLIQGSVAARDNGRIEGLALLNEATAPTADRSPNARLLNAVLALEEHEAPLGKRGQTNLKVAAVGLLRQAGPLGDRLLDAAGAETAEEFAEELVKLRNQFVAHRQGGGRHSDIPAAQQRRCDIWRLVLCWALRVAYLTHMGVSQPGAQRLVGQSHRYTRDCALLRRVAAGESVPEATEPAARSAEAHGSDR